MIKTICTRFVLLFLVTPIVFAQNTNRTIERYSIVGGNLELITSDGKYVLKPFSERILETSFIPNGESFNPDSHAVVLVPESVATTLKDTDASIEFATAGIVAHITKSPFKIGYTYKGRALASEKDGYVRDARGETLNFMLDGTEALYGAGARALGMNRRGNRLALYNKAHYGYETHSDLMNYTMPLVMSSKLYAIHFDNPQIGYLDLDSTKNNTLTYETIGGRKTYQIIAGDTWEDLIKSYTGLTGRQPLPPRWAFGNFASRFGYHTEAEGRATVDKFIAEGIPLDAIIFDLYWFGKDVTGTMGNLQFSRDAFPTPKKMIADFNRQGVKTVLVTEPFVLTTSNRWQEAVREKALATHKNGDPFTYDFFFGNTGLIDVFSEKGATWFWNIYKELIDVGVGGWWGDLGEPEVHPSALQHATGSADQVHNIYGHQWAKLLFDGYKRDFPQQRPFILMRSGYSGSQRFGLIPWSGDVNRTWGGLQSQPEIALQMSMQGLAYMHSDLGGFAGANLDNELYSRWLQYGVFQPIFRPHAQEDVASEPVFRDQKTMALAKQAIQLRYRLMPYNYTIAFDNNQTGLPLMRPLFFEEPRNVKLLGNSTSYLWGHEFLVTPVMKAGLTALALYFPADSAWFDFYSGQRHQGGATETVSVAPDHIPVFVRAGAFVPMIKPIQTTRDYSTRHIDLHYYHDESVVQSNGKLYDDDGTTSNAFEKGAFEIVRFASTFKGGALTISVNSEQGKNHQSEDRNIALSIHNIASKPKRVLVGPKVVPFVWDADTKILATQVVVPKNTGTTVIVK